MAARPCCHLWPRCQLTCASQHLPAPLAGSRGQVASSAWHSCVMHVDACAPLALLACLLLLQGERKTPAPKAPPTQAELEFTRNSRYWMLGAGAAVAGYVVLSGRYVQVGMGPRVQLDVAHAAGEHLTCVAQHACTLPIRRWRCGDCCTCVSELQPYSSACCRADTCS